MKRIDCYNGPVSIDISGDRIQLLIGRGKGTRYAILTLRQAIEVSKTLQTHVSNRLPADHHDEHVQAEFPPMTATRLVH
jgi:hypothetical protein